MNKTLIKEVIAKTLTGTITFPEVLKTLSSEGIESYHMDYLRGESRYYSQNGESFLIKLEHTFPAVAEEFFPEGVVAAIRRSQAGLSKYPDFIRESAAAGCAYYVVYLNGKKVRYFGRDGGEHVEHFPGAK